MNINEQINNYVVENGIKQTFLSKETGMSKDTISKILNNNRRIMADEFLKICQALKIDPRTFYKKSA